MALRVHSKAAVKMPKKGQTPAVDDAFKRVDLAINSVQTLVLTLTAPEPDVSANACGALQKFAKASDKNKVEVGQSQGALEKLIGLLSSEHPNVRHQASLCLATLTDHSLVRKQLREREDQEGYYAALVALLGSDQSPIAHENASCTLANMAREYSSRIHIVNAQAMPPLIALLSSQAADVLQTSLTLLLLLLEEYSNRTQFGALSGLEPLVQILDSEYNKLQQLALQCIAVAARNKANRDTMVDSLNILEKLTSFVSNSEFKASHVHALAALASMLHDSACVQKMAEPGPTTKEGPAPAPISYLLGFVEGGASDVRAQAMVCIGRAATSAQNRRILFDHKAEKSLVAQLISEDPKNPFSPQNVAIACTSLGQLAAGQSNSDAIGQYGGVGKMTKLLGHEDSGVVEAAARTLFACAQSPSNSQLLASDGATKLVEFLGHQSESVCTSAAGCIAALARNPKTRESLDNLNYLPGLVTCVGSDNVALQAQACRAIAIACRNSEARSKIAELNGLEPLSQLVGSAEADVRRPAARAITACSTDPVLAHKLCDLGTLDIIRQAAERANHRSTFLSEAFTGLLAGHLPAKYAWQGILGSKDRINKGCFYDAGKVKTSDPLPVLKQLAVEPINSKRPCIYVNTESSGESSDDEWNQEADSDLTNFITKAIADTEGPLVQRAAGIAATVSESMGGVVPLSKLEQFPYLREEAQLKVDSQSNVLPIGKFINGKGTYYHRALLCKVLLDESDIDSALVRGDYGCAYNVIFAPEPHVIDVMHSPGTIFRIGSTQDLQQPGNFFESALL